VTKFLSSLLVLTLVAGLSAPVVFANEMPEDPMPPALSDQIAEDAGMVGEMGTQAGHDALSNAGQAVIYAGKAVLNGVEFVILKTTQGTMLVLAATVRGIEYAIDGAKFVMIKAKEGVIWVAEQVIKGGQIIVDATCQAVQYVIDGVTYVAIKVAEGAVFVAEKTLELAKKAGKLVIKGVKFVLKKTKQGIIWVAQTSATLARRGALVTELRMNITSGLALGGVGNRKIKYFRSRSQDRDPVIARLGKACLEASEAFNTAYYLTK